MPPCKHRLQRTENPLQASCMLCGELFAANPLASIDPQPQPAPIPMPAPEAPAVVAPPTPIEPSAMERIRFMTEFRAHYRSQHGIEPTSEMVKEEVKKQFGS